VAQPIHVEISGIIELMDVPKMPRGLPPNTLESFIAISALMPLLPRHISLIVLGNTPICFASPDKLLSLSFISISDPINDP